MSGFYRDGTWVDAAVGGPVTGAVEATRATDAAIAHVINGERTASQAMKELLLRYPSLRKDRPDHPLLPLAAFYAKAVMG